MSGLRPALRAGLPGPDSADIKVDITNNFQLDLLGAVADFDDEIRAMCRNVRDLDELLDRLAEDNPTWSLLLSRRGRAWTRRLLAAFIRRGGIVCGWADPARRRD